MADVDLGVTGGLGLIEPTASVDVGEDEASHIEDGKHVVNAEKVALSFADVAVLGPKIPEKSDIFNMFMTELSVKPSKRLFI